MPIPVPLPVGALAIDDTISATAEAFVAAIGQVLRSGTSGATLNTPPTLFPDGTNPGIDPGTGQPYLASLVISTPEQQLFYRQMGAAIAAAIGSGGGGGPPPITVQLVQFDALCPSTVAVGDLVRVASAGHVDITDITDITKLPAIGIVTAKATTTSCTVQTHGIVSGIFTGLTPGLLYYVALDSTLGPIPVPTTGQVLFWQAVGVALDTTSLVLSPSFSLTRVVG
jgi:hypothetical protein